jgi:hypothetical protein
MTEQWRYETAGQLSLWPWRIVLITVLMLPLLGVAVLWGLDYFHGSSPEPHSPHQATQGVAIAPLIEHPGTEWHDYQRRQQQLLKTGGWSDSGKTSARIPVADAMTEFVDNQRHCAENSKEEC